MTASDDLWRLTTFEQTLVSVDVQEHLPRLLPPPRRRRCSRVLRAGDHNELSAMARWDRHEPLANATTLFSFFRDDATFRPALPVADQHVNAFVLGYTFDTRPLSGAGRAAPPTSAT